MKLKQGLLYNILDNRDVKDKYSKSFLSLKNVIDLEQKENKTFDKNIIKKYNNIKDKYDNFLNNIPLNVIETFFYRYSKDLNDYIYIEYHKNEVNDLKVIDIYIMLEDYFKQVFNLACEIANFYNLEIKLNSSSNDNIDSL